MRKETLQTENSLSRSGVGGRINPEPSAKPATSLVDKLLPLDGMNNAVSLPAVNRPNGRILVVGHGQTAADVFDAIGGPHFTPFTTLEFVGIHGQQETMINTINQGVTDVGVTKNEVPVNLLKSGLTVFSPLEIRGGVGIKPERPVTLITRIPGIR